VTDNSTLPEVEDNRLLPGWVLGEWADRPLEHAGVGATVIDREANVPYYNK
jgi:hypothetical protein